MSTDARRILSGACSAALVLSTLLVTGMAQAQDVGREWDRGCEDAKGGSYDRSKHTSAYEDGWQACKAQAAGKPPVAASTAPARPAGAGKAWDRGCSDAKGGSYDRSKHSKDYEAGWQACNKK